MVRCESFTSLEPRGVARLTQSSRRIGYLLGSADLRRAPMRTSTIARKTNETEIDVSLDLDGTGAHQMATGVGFFDHMLDQVSRRSLIDMRVACRGDLHIDAHHTVEDVGIALGQAIRE